MLNVIQELVTSRTQALNRIVFFRDRSELATQILKNEDTALGIIGGMVNTQRSVPIVFSFPMNMDGFNEPVTVAPSSQQISDEIIAITSSSQQSCSICQDSISSDGCQLRGCGHAYHRNCIRVWFATSVRCPVCRRDIRGDQESQTSSESQ